MKRKILMTIEYNGANFFGWQSQDERRTVQGELEEKIALLTGEKVTVEGSGRTDRGVHALNQMATVEIENKMPLQNFKKAINNLLSEDVVVKKVKLVDSSFHPRFSAKKKTYEYRVLLSKTRSAINHQLVTYYPFKVDIERMKNASKLLIGRHNFKAFCSSHATVKDFDREIYDIQIKKRGNLLTIEVTGNGFLYNMVRIIVGTLLEIDKIGEENIISALLSGERKLVGKTMPPNGLYLKKVDYMLL